MDSRPGQTGGTRLLLLVCGGRQNSSEAACANATLPVAPDSAPSFVSVAFLRASTEQAHWVVGVYGFVFAVDTAEHHPRVVLQKQLLQSELRDLQFLKVDPLFYTFIRSNASLPAAYGVIVVPISSTMKPSRPRLLTLLRARPRNLY